MSIRERISGVWLISMTLLAMLAYTVFFVAQMWLNLLFAVYLALVILTSAALIIASRHLVFAVLRISFMILTLLFS